MKTALCLPKATAAACVEASAVPGRYLATIAGSEAPRLGGQRTRRPGETLPFMEGAARILLPPLRWFCFVLFCFNKQPKTPAIKLQIVTPAKETKDSLVVLGQTNCRGQLSEGVPSVGYR